MSCDRDTPKQPAPDARPPAASSSAPLRPEDFANMAMVYGAPPRPEPSAASSARAPGDGGAASGEVSGTPRHAAAIGTVEASRVPGAARIVAGMRAGFRACYKRALSAEPGLEGRVHVTIAVGKGGEVLSTKAKPAQPAMAAVTSCVEMRARAARFDPPEGGQGTVSFAVTFVRQ